MQNSAVERKRVVYPVSLSDREIKLLDVISEKTGASKAQAIREAIKAYADEIKGLEITKLRDISEAQAKKEILSYLKKHDRALTSDIADELKARHRSRE